MNYGSLRRYLRIRYMKAADDGGAGGGSVSSTPGSDAGVPSPGGDGGGSSVPSTPSDGGAGGSTPTPSSPDSTANMWANLGSQDDLDYVEIQPPVAPVAPQTPPVAPQVPPVAPAAAQTVSPQQPQAPQVPPVAPQTPTTPSQEPSAPQVELSPSDPVGMADAMEQNREALIGHLAQTRFALTPEEVQAIETDAVGAIPKLLARVHLDSQIAMQRFLAQAVPGMIQRHSTVSRANDEAENKFFEAHKARGLDKSNAQHRAAAVRVAKLYRQMNPQMSLDQLIADIGPMVAQAVGAQPSGTTPAPQALPPGTIVRGGQPFRPAVNGGGSPVPPQQAAPDGNDWGAGFGRDYD